MIAPSRPVPLNAPPHGLHPLETQPGQPYTVAATFSRVSASDATAGVAMMFARLQANLLDANGQPFVVKGEHPVYSDALAALTTAIRACLCGSTACTVPNPARSGSANTGGAVFDPHAGEIFEPTYIALSMVEALESSGTVLPCECA